MRALLTACFLLVGQAANAVVIDFEELPGGETPTPITSQGFDFSTSDSFFILSPADFDTQALYFCPWCELTIEDASGDSFRLNAFIFNTAGEYTQGISITGFYESGGSISADLDVSFAGKYFEFDSAWDNLTHVVIDGNDGTLGNGIDNIIVNGVPIPAAVWLFGSGLGLLGWMRRRQEA